MSYDLFFFPRPDGSPAVAEILDYFRARPHYEVSEKQAGYDNEDSGVSFLWDIGLEETDGAEADERPSLVALNLNYFRPHVFGLEAEPEVTAFVAAFGLPLLDPQIGGMGEGPYSPEGFLAAYNRGNELAYGIILESKAPAERPHVLPGPLLESCWRWNFERTSLQARLGDSAFVPMIMFFEREGRLQTGAVWTDGIPSALPDVDLYGIARIRLAPRRLLRAKPDLTLIPAERAAEVLAAYPVRQGTLPYRMLDYAKRPAVITRWVRGLAPSSEEPCRVAADSILNAELVERHLK